MNILAARVAAANETLRRELRAAVLGMDQANAVDRCILAREVLAVMYDRMAACVRRGDSSLPTAELADAVEAFDRVLCALVTESL